MTSLAGPSGRVFTSQTEACAWHVNNLPPDCQSASLLDLAALWRSRASLLNQLGRGAQLVTRIDAHASAGLTGALAQLGCGVRVRARDDLMGAISSGLDGSSLLLDNPCNKTRSLINLAKRQGVAMTTFDNASEAAKLAELWPTVSALLLVRADDSDALLGDAALGADSNSLAEILMFAKRVGLDVAGVAVADCSKTTVLEVARLAMSIGRQFGHRMSLLDIGCLGNDVNNIESIANEVHRCFDDLGLESDKLRLMCDPTETLLARSIVVATRVVAKVTLSPSNDANEKNGLLCTVGDSTFGAFAGWRLRADCNGLSDSTPELMALVHVRSLQDISDADDAEEMIADKIWLQGFTETPDDQLGCLNGIDNWLSSNLQIGDWLLWSGVGADDSRMGRRANVLPEPQFRCFLQTGREMPQKASPSLLRCGADHRAATCRTRHSSSCCYSDSLASSAAVISSADSVNNDAVNNRQLSSSDANAAASAREICCSVLLS